MGGCWGGWRCGVDSFFGVVFVACAWEGLRGGWVGGGEFVDDAGTLRLGVV